jgi:hypothetical protein
MSRLDNYLTEAKKVNLKQYNTDDYQKRQAKGNSPRSGIPDSIYAGRDSITFTFKNTPEKHVKLWIEKWIKDKKLKYTSITTNQAGDYHDDWVEVDVKGIK